MQFQPPRLADSTLSQSNLVCHSLLGPRMSSHCAQVRNLIYETKLANDNQQQSSDLHNIPFVSFANYRASYSYSFIMYRLHKQSTWETCHAQATIMMSLSLTLQMYIAGTSGAVYPDLIKNLHIVIIACL